MRTAGSILLLTGVLVLAVAGPVGADGLFGLYSDPAGASPCINPNYLSFDVHFVYKDGPPVSVIEFRAPGYNTGGVTPWTLVPVVGTVTGNIESGLRIDLGGCYSSPVHVLTVECFYSGPGFPGCRLWDILDLVLTDCDGNPIPNPSWKEGVVTFEPCSIEAENPGPADGASDVSASVTLTWEAPGPPSCIGIPLFQLYFGTEPQPPLVSTWVRPPHTVTDLDAGATYYWQIFSTTAFYDPVTGPVWSFTTLGDVVPIEMTTWGRLKALYRKQP